MSFVGSTILVISIGCKNSFETHVWKSESSKCSWNTMTFSIFFVSKQIHLCIPVKSPQSTPPLLCTPGDHACARILSIKFQKSTLSKILLGAVNQQIDDLSLSPPCLSNTLFFFLTEEKYNMKACICLEKISHASIQQNVCACAPGYVFLWNNVFHFIIKCMLLKATVLTVHVYVHPPIFTISENTRNYPFENISQITRLFLKACHCRSSFPGLIS